MLKIFDELIVIFTKYFLLEWEIFLMVDAENSLWILAQEAFGWKLLLKLVYYMMRDFGDLQSAHQC